MLSSKTHWISPVARRSISDTSDRQQVPPFNEELFPVESSAVLEGTRKSFFRMG